MTGRSKASVFFTCMICRSMSSVCSLMVGRSKTSVFFTYDWKEQDFSVLHLWLAGAGLKCFSLMIDRSKTSVWLTYDCQKQDFSMLHLWLVGAWLLCSSLMIGRSKTSVFVTYDWQEQDFSVLHLWLAAYEPGGLPAGVVSAIQYSWLTESSRLSLSFNIPDWQNPVGGLHHSIFLTDRI